MSFIIVITIIITIITTIIIIIIFIITIATSSLYSLSPRQFYKPTPPLPRPVLPSYDRGTIFIITP